MLEVNTDTSKSHGSEFKKILGIKFLVNYYKEYIHVLKKIKNKYAIGFTWATTPGDYWYMKQPGDRPFVWTCKKPIKLNHNEGVLVYQVYIGRLRIGFAKKHSLIPCPISAKILLFQDKTEYTAQEIADRVLIWRGTIEASEDNQQIWGYIMSYSRHVFFERNENNYFVKKEVSVQSEDKKN